jgi:diaminopimelate decarboxylase
MAFARRHGELLAEEVPLDGLAERVGTPAYVYSANTIRHRYQQLTTVLAPIPHRIHYACKANGNLALLSLLRHAGACVDVVSSGELFRARRAGFTGKEIIFGGVGKTSAELAEALEAGVTLISVESLDEVELLNALAAERGVEARVGIRVNPEVAVESFHEYIKTGEKGDKFGVPWDEAERVAVASHRLSHVRLVAVGMHIGSQLSRLAPYGHGLERLEQLVANLRRSGVDTIEYLDVGGGLFVPYHGDEAPCDLAAYAAVILPVVRRLGLTLIVEPGRYLVAESGVLLTRVLYRKRSGGREILVADAGMSDLLRPSHYNAYHDIVPIRGTAGQKCFDVVGPICESGDFLALGREMADVGPGSLLAVLTTGAYGYAMTSNYNARRRPPEVLVDGARWAIITERESCEQLIAREHVNPDWRTVT